MRKLLLLLLIAFIGLPAAAQNTKPIRLIVRGDDMGMTHAVNLACIDAYQNGIMKSVEVMAPTPWFPEAVALLKEHPGLDVGIHLVLTSEWETLKWRPLTYAPSIVDSNGYFFPMIWPNDNYPEDRALLGAEWKLDEIEQELRAQIELVRKTIPQLSHVSCHMGFNGLSKDIDALVRRLAKEYNLDIDLKEHGVQMSGGYDGASKTPEEKVASFIRMLEKLEAGDYLFLDHPGYDTPEMQAIFHIGYENVADDREGVTQLFKDPRIKEAIENRGIEIISYRALKQ